MSTSCAALAAAILAALTPAPPRTWHDEAVADRCNARPDSCAWSASSPELLEAVAAVESGGQWWAVSPGGGCFGKFQLCARFARLPWPALFVPALAEHEARRQLDGWIGLAGGNVRRGLAGYRYGYPGLRGLRGDEYAAAVLAQLAAASR